MYVVRNLTKRTIILSDLRAEIGPYKMLDLEKVAHREAIERSADLRTARKSSRLRLMSNSVVSQKPPKEVIVERVIEKHIEKPSEDAIDEERLEAIMRRILSEQTKEPTTPQDNTSVILNAVAALKEQLAKMGSGDDLSGMPDIDPALFADLQSKAVEKISESIETGVKKAPKKVKLKNTKSTELANELD